MFRNREAYYKKDRHTNNRERKRVRQRIGKSERVDKRKRLRIQTNRIKGEKE